MAKPERKSFKVTRGNTTLTVYPYRHPKSGKQGWRYAWRKHESDPWRYTTCGTQAEGKQSAWDKIGELGEGGLIWSALDAETRRFLQDVHRTSEKSDFEAVLAFIATRKRSALIAASVARYIAEKVEKKGEETRHIGNIRRDLEAMSTHFPERAVTDITDGELKEWWTLRRGENGKKSANHIRGSVVGFWNWAIREKIFPKEVTPAEKLPLLDLDDHERRVLSRDEVVEVLKHVHEEWRVWVVLGAFAGLRPEEIAPPQKKGASKKGKRGIRCEEIDWDFKVIYLPACVSKVETDRIVPLTDECLAWLEWAGLRRGMIGPVCKSNPSEKPKKDPETVRLGREVFKTGWPQDVLRHSYGSYRNAVIRNLPQVAEEMGTSEAMLRKHYHRPKRLEEGKEWFALHPNVIRCDPMESGLDSESEVILRTGTP